MCTVVTATTPTKIALNADRRRVVWMLFPLWQQHAAEQILTSASVRLEIVDHENYSYCE